MEPTDKQIQGIKDILEKKKGRECSWEEASKVAWDLLSFARMLLDFTLEDNQRRKRLEECPGGFHLEGSGYNCFICGRITSEGQSWYDEFGIKCMTCQGAVDCNEIPASVAKNKDSWYSESDIQSYFNISPAVLRKWIKEGIIKARTIIRNRKIHFRIFLIEDDKEMLPPKQLVKSRMVIETIDGKDFQYLKPWYKFVNPLEYLKGYKIMNYLKVTYDDTPLV